MSNSNVYFVDNQKSKAVLSVISSAMILYKESYRIMKEFNIDEDDYMESKDKACDLIDEALFQLKTIRTNNNHVHIQEMLDSTIHLLSVYNGCVLLQSFANKAITADNMEYSTYLIRNPQTRLVKIGKSGDVDHRVKALQCGAGTKLELVGVISKNVEGELHKKFSDKKVFNEWFDDSDGSIEKLFKKKQRIIQTKPR